MFVLDLALLKAMIFLLALIIVNVVLGVAISIRKGNFDFAKLPRFLSTEVMPYYLSLSALTLLAMVQDVQNYGTKPLAWASIVAYGSRAVFVELRNKVVELFGPVDAGAKHKKRKAYLLRRRQSWGNKQGFAA
ncbi:MAG: hypothetical protein GX425_02685 [Peptococcaceae bacterium]|nr:hypothetical protein [Peptococcaceae bacterium]